jgi:putative oligomerization/nucleic acid binding protein
MGLMFRRRRPLMRVAGAAAVGTVAYQSGKRHEEQAQVNEQAQQAYAATQPPPQPEAPAPAPAAAAPADDTTAELERLAQLHQSGALTDDEFAAAKSKLLGI